MDGTGLGEDGAAWGGELLHIFPNGTFDRVGHLKEIALPGGDQVVCVFCRMGSVM